VHQLAVHSRFDRAPAEKSPVQTSSFGSCWYAEHSASNFASSFSTRSLSVDSASAVSSRRVLISTASAVRASKRLERSRITSAISTSDFSGPEERFFCGRNFPSVSLRTRSSSNEAMETRRRLLMPSCSTLPSSSPSCIYVRMVRGVTPSASAATLVVILPWSPEFPTRSPPMRFSPIGGMVHPYRGPRCLKGDRRGWCNFLIVSGPG
jgi:hypothetical protein